MFLNKFQSGSYRFFAFLLILFFGILTIASAKNDSKTLILKARLFKIEAFNPELVVDAVDLASAQGTIPTATVSFLVKSVSKGELPPQKQPENSSVVDQAKDAVKDRNILKIITMDFKNPDLEHPESTRWFLIGVQSPLESFKVTSWKDLPKESYRLVLSKTSNEAGWVLQSAEKV